MNGLVIQFYKIRFKLFLILDIWYKNRRIRLLNVLHAITTKRIYLNPFGYLSPWGITDQIFIITKADDEDYTFETIVSNK